MVKALSNDANIGLSDADSLHMGAERYERFRRELLKLDDAIQSLVAAVPSFPNGEFSSGEMEPRSTVTAFASMMDRQLGLLLAMVNGEEHLNEGMREGGRNND